MDDKTMYPKYYDILIVDQSYFYTGKAVIFLISLRQKVLIPDI